MSVGMAGVLEAIKKLTKERGYPPTVRELCDECGLSSTSSVHNHLTALSHKGLIKYEPTKSRTIVVLK